MNEITVRELRQALLAMPDKMTVAELRRALFEIENQDKPVRAAEGEIARAVQ